MMKRWTLALMSMIMLILPWMAFAGGEATGNAPEAVLPEPTFNPASGSTVAPGTTITFDVTANLADYNNIAFVLYVENDDNVELECTADYLLSIINGGIGGQELGLSEPKLQAKANAFQVAWFMDEMGWMMPATISPTASGDVKMRARLAALTSDYTVVYSKIVTATYTVEGKMVRPDAPSFSMPAGQVASGTEVSLTNGYEADEEMAHLYPICYVIDGKDEDFDINNALMIEGSKLSQYDGPIVVEKPMTIKAATAQIDPTTYSIIWSEIETVDYTVGGGEQPEQPETTYMKFQPESGSKLTIVEGASTGVSIKAVAQDGKKGEIYYRILTEDGADQNAPISEADKKIAVEQVGNGFFEQPIEVKESMVKAGKFMVKAAVKLADGSFSPAVTATYDVEILRMKFPIALTMTPLRAELMIGEQYTYTVQADADAETMAKYANTEAVVAIKSLSSLKMFSELEYAFFKEGEPEKWVSFMEEMQDGGSLAEITTGVNIKTFAASNFKLRFTMAREYKAAMLNMNVALIQSLPGALEAETYGYLDLSVPIVKRPAEDPAFSPAPGYIEKGKTVTLSCATDGAEIHYTLDGTEPTAQSPKYTSPIAVNGLTPIKAVAFKDGGSSFVVEGVYSIVGLPQITPASGTVVIDSLAKITLKETPDAEIYYTLDGTEPTKTNGTKYTAPFPIGATVKQLKAVAVLGEDRSPVVTAEYRMIPAKPQVSVKAGKVAFGTEMTITCPTQNAEIYWSFGSSEPISKATGKLYDGKPITLKLSGVLKAIAYYGADSSQPLSAKYTVALSTPEFSLTPGAVPSGARVTLTSESKELNTNPNKKYHIVYTLDDSEPSNKNGIEYTEPIEITKAVTIKAMTWVMGTSGVEKSEVAKAVYWLTGDEAPVVEVAAPTFDPAAGEVEKGTQVGLSTTTAGAKVYYTLDGSEPTAASTEYQKPIVVNESLTVKAIALFGENKSEVVSAAYTVRREQVDVITPTFDPAAGEVEKGTKVTIACVTEGAKIYYTVDGSAPTAESAEYKEAVVIDKDLTLKAIAMVGEAKSSIATAAYTVKAAGTVATPTFDPVAGEVEKGTKVTIACATEGAKIYYTVDGSEPTAESAEYKEAVVIDKDLTLKAIAIKGDAKSAVAEAAYTVKVANEEVELAGVNVYPNPNGGAFSLDLPVPATVEVFASNGVLRERINAGAGVLSLSLDRSGIYFLRITGEGRTTVKRIVVR